MNGLKTDASRDNSPCVCTIVLAIADAKPNKISAIASSKATTLNRVSVSGPFALYSLMTIIVEAGSVAAAMAPNIIANAKSTPISSNPAVTISTAPADSNRAIITGPKPTRLK